VNQFFEALPGDVDALVVMTPTPLASMDPDGTSQKLVGGRTDDVEAFKRGDEQNVLNPESTEDIDDLVLAAASSHLRRITGGPVNLGSFKVGNIDEARDQWSHAFARSEQVDLLKKANRARFSNRPPGSPRGLIFVSGDIHVGAIFDISMSDPDCAVVSITSSGISTVKNKKPTVGSIVDESFSLGSGIHSTLRDVVVEFNFGIVQIIPNQAGAEIVPTLAHRGNSFAVGVDIADLL